MKITVLGCGNAFSKLNYNQSFLIEEGSSKMLIDCGSQTIDALDNAEVPLSEVTDIYISHAHSDHIGALETVAFARYDWANRPHHWKDSDKPYINLRANSKLMVELWEKSLSGGLESMEGFVATFDTFFKTCPVQGNETFSWEGWTFELIQQVHIMTGSTIASTFGLMMSKKGEKSYYFTTDSQHCSPKQMDVFYKKADIIFQDCECTPFSSGVHANYGQLAGYPEFNSVRLSPEVKGKMWLSHYQDFVSRGKDFFGNPCNWAEKAEEDGFRGFLTVGQTTF